MSLRPNVMVLDIETTSINADNGYIICIGWRDEATGRTRLMFVPNPKREAETLKRFLGILSRYHICFTWKGRIFDMPYLVARSIKHGLDPSPIYSVKHIDLADVVKEHLRLSSDNMWTLCRFLGIARDYSVTGMDVPDLYSRYLAGGRGLRAEIISHCRDDLTATSSLLRRLKPLLRSVFRELPSLP